MILKRPLVIDLSAWEMDVFWDRQASDTPLLMITRLTLGKAYVDFMATSHVNGARSIGSKVGVYHFMEFNDVQGQIDNFLNACRERGYLVNGQWTLDVPPVLDVEKTPNGMGLLFGKIPNPKRGQPSPLELQPKNGFIASVLGVFVALASDPEGDSWAYQIKVWLDAVETATGQRPWIYTSQNYWKYTFSREGKPPAWTKDYESWAAWYPDNPDLHEWIPKSVIPEGWDEVKAWQYSAAGILPMCPYDGIDMNKASDKLLAELDAPAPPPPTGETKMQVTANYNVNIRANHVSTSEDVGDFLKSQTAEVSELFETGATKGVDYEQWAKIPAGWVAVWFKGIGSGGQLCTLSGELPPPPPPPTGEVKPSSMDLVLHYADGTQQAVNGITLPDAT